MNLPDGIKHAVHMGANEAADAKRFVAELAAWDDGSKAAPS